MTSKNDRSNSYPMNESRFDLDAPNFGGLLTAITAKFFCVPIQYANRVPRAHWIKHERVMLFSLFVAFPLSALAWAHMTGLLVGNRQMENVLLIQCAAAAFMVIASAIMDSMLSGTLAERRFTATALAVIVFRQFMALAVAASLSLGAVLFFLGGQLDRQRANLALSVNESDRERVRAIHDLAKLESAAANAKAAVVDAEKQRNSIPAEVLTLEGKVHQCLAEQEAMKINRSHRLPELSGLKTQLEMQSQYGAASPEAVGKIESTRREITELDRRIRLKGDACNRLDKDRRFILSRHQQNAAMALKQASARRQNVERQVGDAARAANAQLKDLQKATDMAWDKNLAAQVKAAWHLVTHEIWAALLSIVIFVVSIILELSPLLGKVALRGGPLDQVTELDNEAIRQQLMTIMMVNSQVSEKKREAMLATSAEIAEVAAIRHAMEVVLGEVDIMYRRREAAYQNAPDDVREVVISVFQTALRKVAERYMGKHASAGVLRAQD